MVIHLDIGTVVKHIQGTIDVDFQRRGDILRLRFALFAKEVVQIPQDWHVFRARVLQIVPVHKPCAAVNDRLFNRGKPLLAADDKVTQRQDKITFQGDRVFIIRIVQVYIHRIDVVSGVRGNVNDLPLSSKLLYQRPVLIFRVCYDNVVLRQKEHIDDLTLGRKGLAAAGRPQEQAVGVFQVLAVRHNQVVTKGVETVI